MITYSILIHGRTISQYIFKTRHKRLIYTEYLVDKLWKPEYEKVDIGYYDEYNFMRGGNGGFLYTNDNYIIVFQTTDYETYVEFHTEFNMISKL